MVVSFDFDQTMYDWTTDGPVPTGLKLMVKHLQHGDTVYVVTARGPGFEETYDLQRPEVLLERWELLPHLAGVHRTDYALKGPTLAQMGVQLHYDDSPEELASARAYGVKTVSAESWT